MDDKTKAQLHKNRVEHRKRVHAMHVRLQHEKENQDKQPTEDPVLAQVRKDEAKRDKLAQEHKKQPKTKLQIITMTAVWAMIVFMLASVIIPAFSQLAQNYF